ILVTDEINLSYRVSVFSFEFAALIYNDPEKNQYAYRMEGFDKEWIYCGIRRFVTYTNLEPGDYVFRVRGSNNDGIWNEEGKSIRISISPPFWKTWWFKSLGVMSIIGTTGMAYQQKLSKVEKEKKAQENFSRRLIESQETERKKIASELHDTVAHEILITKNKIALGYKDTQDPDKIKTLLNDISELSTNTLNEVRSISYNLHPHQLERLGLTKAIKSIVNNIAKSTEINFTAAIDNIDNIFSKELEINIYRIVQECFNNIIKHSRATEAVLNISRHKSNIIIIISDNGKGFSKNVTKGIGMNSIEERIKLYNGSLKINSEINKGAFMKIIIPMKKIK
ncbi:MAG: histidine kinase, partial [Ignavibacteria bacterium]|nr:histidine kinase [Ignavibacteria bacterium]